MYFQSLSLCWCDASSWHVIQRHTFRHGKQKSPKKQALHLTCLVLCVDHTVHGNITANTFFPESLVCSVLTRFITQELTFSFHFGMAIWNDWKWVVSPGSDTKEQELNQKLRLISWFKTRTPIGCGTTNTTETKGTHTACCWCIRYPHAHEIKNKKNVSFFGGKA